MFLRVNFLKMIRTVLGQTLFRNIEVAHHLRRAPGRRATLLGRRSFSAQIPSTRLAYDEVLFLGVRCECRMPPKNIGILNDAIGQLNDRCGFLIGEVVITRAISTVSILHVDYIRDLRHFAPLPTTGPALASPSPPIYCFSRLSIRDRGGDSDFIDSEIRGVLEVFARGIIQRICHQNGHGGRALPVCRVGSACAE